MSSWMGAVPGVVSGIVWPAIPRDEAARLMALLFQLEQSQWWDEERLRGHQDEQLRLLLIHAANHVAYYCCQPEYGLCAKASGEELRQAFRRLPILDRRAIQEAGHDMRSAQVPPEHGPVTEGMTSGSTGSPLRFWHTAHAGLLWQAFLMREHFWFGRDFSLRHAFIRAHGDGKLYPGWGLPVALLQAAGDSAALQFTHPIAEQCRWLMALQPHYLLCTQSTLRALAREALEGRLQLSRLREVRSIGETLAGDLRSTVFQAWNVGVTDCYTASEVGYMALQCPVSGAYHVQSEGVLLEVLDGDGQPCRVGEVGRVVVTVLGNFAHPLIRYDLGDYAEVGETCACGRGLPALRRILGRRRNRLQRPDGGHAWPGLSTLPWPEAILRFQLRQRADLSLLLRYEGRREMTEGEKAGLASALLEHLRCRLSVDFERVGALPLSAAGKHEDFISEAAP